MTVGTQLRRCDDIIWCWIQTEISRQSESVWNCYYLVKIFFPYTCILYGLFFLVFFYLLLQQTHIKIRCHDISSFLMQKISMKYCLNQYIWLHIHSKAIINTKFKMWLINETIYIRRKFEAIIINQSEMVWHSMKNNKIFALQNCCFSL